MALQQLTVAVRSALARLKTRRAPTFCPPTNRARPIVDGPQTLIVSGGYGRKAEIPLTHFPERLPEWATRVTLPASFDQHELDSVLLSLAPVHSITELVLERPPLDNTDLRLVAPLGQLRTVKVRTDWDYPESPNRLPRGASFDVQLTHLAALVRLRELTLCAPADIIELGALSPLTELRQLRLWGHLTDLRPLRNFPHLENLSIHSRPLEDLRPLAALSELSHLDVDWSRVDDLAPLRESHLEVLSLKGTPVADLSPLANLHALDELDLSNTQVAELAPLAQLPLSQLLLDGTPVADVSPLAACTLLEELDLSRSLVTDVSSLSRLPDLRRLSVTGTRVRRSQLLALNLPNTRVDGLRILPANDDTVSFKDVLSPTLSDTSTENVPSAPDEASTPPHVTWDGTPIDTCTCSHWADKPAIKPHTEAFIAAVVPGSTTRDQVEHALGEPVHVRCAQCRRDDVDYVEYVFSGALTDEGRPCLLCAAITYSTEGTVKEIYIGRVPAEDTAADARLLSSPCGGPPEHY